MQAAPQRNTTLMWWVMVAMVAGLYYNSHLNVDQFSTQHRMHMVPLKQRVDKQQVEWMLERDGGGVEKLTEEEEEQTEADR